MGCGSGNISVNPSYNSSGTGAYDAMFHLQNEDTWAVVNSAIMMVGNLAVAQANGMDDYYWEIYHLMGDPSLSTYQGIPQEINANYDLFYLLVLKRLKFKLILLATLDCLKVMN